MKNKSSKNSNYEQFLWFRVAVMAERICGGSACGDGGELTTKHLCHQRVNSHPLSWLHKAQMSHTATRQCLPVTVGCGGKSAFQIRSAPNLFSHLDDGNVLHDKVARVLPDTGNISISKLTSGISRKQGHEILRMAHWCLYDEVID